MMSVIEKVQDLIDQCDELLEECRGDEVERELCLVARGIAWEVMELFEDGDIGEFHIQLGRLMLYAIDEGFMVMESDGEEE